MEFVVENRKVAKYSLRVIYVSIHFVIGLLILSLLSDSTEVFDDSLSTEFITITLSVVTTIWSSWGWDRVKLIGPNTHLIDITHELSKYTAVGASLFIAIGTTLLAVEKGDEGLFVEWGWLINGYLNDNIMYSVLALMTSFAVTLGLPVNAGLSVQKNIE
ncbi:MULTISPECIES: hypothetical protein [Vibrio harveyi group]|uniref:hypothetical protein n=1 Tax=Vibrio harveyi group TaxID=717610 RepID=UPI00106E2BE8|nr:hypothetical protein [Vibrio diabolicus]